MRGEPGPRAVFGRVVVGKRKARSAAYVSGPDETLPAMGILRYTMIARPTSASAAVSNARLFVILPASASAVSRAKVQSRSA